MRVTQQMLSRSSLNSLQQSLNRTQTLQERLATGRVLNRPSDSPTGLVTAMQTRGAQARNTTHLKNADNALGWLSTADTALQGAVSQLRRARELAVQADNASVGPVGREAIAAEIEVLREGLMEITNSRFAGRLIFTGHSDTTQAYDAAGNYLGDGGAVNRTLQDGQQIQVNLTGAAVFGSGNGSVFALMDQIANDLRNDPGNVVANNLDALDGVMDDVLSALGDVGARTNRVEAMQDRGSQTELNLASRLSQVESTDLPETIMELQLQEVAYQSALSATSRVIQPTLLDFLR